MASSSSISSTRNPIRSATRAAARTKPAGSEASSSSCNAASARTRWRKAPSPDAVTLARYRSSVVDLGELTAGHFDPIIGDGFVVEGCDPAVELTLVEVDRRAREPDANRPFTLLFTGPTEVRLAQGVWRLAHGTLGALDIFLVPVGLRGDVPIYEAVFG